MTRWVIRHRTIVTLVLSFVVASAGGVYVNMWTTALASDPSIATCAKTVGRWHIMVLVAALAMFAQYRISSVEDSRYANLAGRLIDEVLAAASRSLVFPRKNRNLRAIVTIADQSHETRTTRYAYHVEPDPERTATFPIYFGITGEAMRDRRVVVQGLEPDHVSGYDPITAPKILPDLRSVLAAPLYSFGDQSRETIGVLAFDSVNTVKELQLDNREMIELAQAWADIVAVLHQMKKGDIDAY